MHIEDRKTIVITRFHNALLGINFITDADVARRLEMMILLLLLCSIIFPNMKTSHWKKSNNNTNTYKEKYIHVCRKKDSSESYEH